MINLDEYIFDLESPIEETRARAIMSLVKSNDDRAIPYLEKAAEHDESAQIRYYARKGLKLIKSRAIHAESPPSGGSISDGNIGPTIKNLLDSADVADRKRGVTLVARLNEPVHYQALEDAYIQEDDPIVKSQMLTTLAAIGHDKGRRHVAEALTSANHRLRASAVESVTFLADEELMDQVIPLLQDEDHRVVANATVALKNYGKLNVLNTLSTMIESPEVNQRDAAAFALTKFKTEATLPLLMKASRDSEETVRLKGIEGLKALAENGSDKAKEILEKADPEDPEGFADYFSLAVEDPIEQDLVHEEFSVRLEAVKEIVKAKARDKLPALKKALENEADTYVKATMVLAIGQLGTVDDARCLLPFLESTEPRVRANAVEAVGCIASSDDLESLLPYLGDRNNRVRANAVIALKNAYPGKAIETLKLMAGSDDLRMKISAAYACFEVGSEAAVGILKGLAADDDIRVAGKAIWSLDMLKEKGSEIAGSVLNELNIKVGDLNETDSFIGIDDGSFIRLTPSPEPGEKPSEKSYGQQSLLSSLQSEYGIKAEIDLKDTAQVARRSAVPLKSGAFKTTGDKYAVVSEIGRGGMGVILSSKDLDIRREVAMKVITDQGKTSREFIERFIEEAQVQGQLEHPNICPVHELGRDSNGRIYFTMKMVKGRSLAEMIKRWKLTPAANSHQRITEALNIFLKICDGVAFAHSKGVIHRDLKPANIMVGDFGEVYVMDWGLAKIIGVEDDCKDDLVITDRQEDGNVIKTMAGSVIGTPVYMPPEQAKGQVDLMDERSDIYSLGAVLYELLTLDIPFTGTSPWDVIRKVTADPPVPVTEKVAEGTIASELNTIVMKCLEKEPGERYRNVKELKQEVEFFLAGKPIAAMEYSLRELMYKWIKRNRIVVAGAVAAFFCLIIGMLAVGWHNRRVKHEKVAMILNSAETLKETRDYVQAKDELLKVLGLDPGNSEAISLLEEVSISADKQKDHEKAQVIMEEVRVIQKKIENDYQKITPDTYLTLLDREQREEYLNASLSVLNLLNQVIRLSPDMEEAKKNGYALGLRIASLVVKTGDYSLATYMLKEACHFREDPRLEEKLFRQLEQVRTKTLREHLARWTEIKKTLAAGKDEAGEFDDFLFELSKMTENEVVQELIKAVEHENLKVKTLTVKALGRIGNQLAVEKLMESLESECERLSNIEAGQRARNDVTFMVDLAQAIANIGDSGVLNRLQAVRRDMGYTNLFSERTSLVMEKLEKLSKGVEFRTYDPSSTSLEEIISSIEKEDGAEIGSFQKTSHQELFDIIDILFESKQYDEVIQQCSLFISGDFHRSLAYHKRGNAYVAKGEYDQAIDDFNQILILDPQNVEAFGGLGIAYTQKGEYDRAIEGYSQALKFATQDEVTCLTFINRGNAYVAKGDYDRAIDDFNQALELNPQSTLAFVYRGNTYVLKGEYDRGIRDLKQVLNLDPKSEKAYLYRANAYREQGNYDLAIEDYTHVLELNPQFADAYRKRGTVYYQKGDFARGVQDYTQALNLSPQDAAVYCLRGSAYLDIGDYDRAIEDTTQALKLNPKDSDAYRSRGCAYCYKGEYDRAIIDLSKALQLNPEDSRAYSTRGAAYCAKGDYDQGFRDFAQALNLNPQLYSVYQNRGRVYLIKGDFDRAIEDYTQALKINPHDAISFGCRGDVYFDKGDYAQAINDYTQGLVLNSQSANVYCNRGNAYLKQGDYDWAIKDYTQALKLVSRNEVALASYRNRASAYFAKEAYDHAIEDLNQALKLNPHDVGSYFNRGRAYLCKGKYNQGIEDLSWVINNSHEKKYVQSAKQMVVKIKEMLRETEN